MAALWNVEVLSLSGAIVELGVRVAHPDAGPFPRSPVFALRVLFEDSQALGDDFEDVPKGPLGELSGDDVRDEDWAAAHAGEFIAALEVTTQGPAQVDDGFARQRVTQILRSAGLHPEEPRWEEAFDAEWRRFWKDPAVLPYAVYRITATDAKCLAHLMVGARWGSAAWA
jgi:hypothetical protein